MAHGSDPGSASADCGRQLHRAPCNSRLPSEGTGGFSQTGACDHHYLKSAAGRSGARGLQAKATYERSSSDSVLCELSFSLQRKNEQLATPGVLEEMSIPTRIIGNEVPA